MYNAKFDIGIISENYHGGFDIRETTTIKTINGKRTIKIKEEKIPWFKSYNMAYVVKSNFTVTDFFK